MWAASTKTQVVGILGYAGRASAASAPAPAPARAAPASAFAAIRKGISDTLTCVALARSRQHWHSSQIAPPLLSFSFGPCVSSVAVVQFIVGDTESHYQLPPN